MLYRNHLELQIPPLHLKTGLSYKILICLGLSRKSTMANKNDNTTFLAAVLCISHLFFLEYIPISSQLFISPLLFLSLIIKELNKKLIESYQFFWKVPLSNLQLYSKFLSGAWDCAICSGFISFAFLLFMAIYIFFNNKCYHLFAPPQCFQIELLNLNYICYQYIHFLL